MYPVSERVRERCADLLKDVDVENGTIRLLLDQQLPTALITRLRIVRAAEVAEEQAARAIAKSTKKTATKKTATKKKTAKKKTA